MSTGLTIELGPFTETLRQYAAATTRDTVDVLNKEAKDVGLTAARIAQRAKKGDIDRLSTLWRFGDKMWVRKISKMLKEDGNWAVGKIGKRQEKALKKLLVYGQHGAVRASLRTLAAQALSKKLLGSRKRAIGFVAHAFAMAARLADPKSQGNLPPGRGKSKAKGWAKPANIGQGDQLVATLLMSYENNHKDGAVRVAMPALQKAVDIERADMIAYIQRKVRENGRKFSSKGARNG